MLDEFDQYAFIGSKDSIGKRSRATRYCGGITRLTFWTKLESGPWGKLANSSQA